jgi:hypothetical protein
MANDEAAGGGWQPSELPELFALRNDGWGAHHKGVFQRRMDALAWNLCGIKLQIEDRKSQIERLGGS